MLAAASEPIPSPLLVVIVAAAPGANENCNINADLTKIDDEATTSGCIASQVGSFVVGVTTIICSREWLSESSPVSSMSGALLVDEESPLILRTC